MILFYVFYNYKNVLEYNYFVLESYLIFHIYDTHFTCKLKTEADIREYEAYFVCCYSLDLNFEWIYFLSVVLPANIPQFFFKNA